MAKKKQSKDYKFLGNCPICSKKFASQDVTPIDESASMNTFYAECAKCESSVILGVIKNIPGIIKTVGMLTDMKLEDIDKMSAVSPLTYDDVLEIHKQLEGK